VRARRQNDALKVEVLYFDGCPSTDRLLPRLRELVALAAVPVDVELRRVETPEAAVAARFLGSPTVRVDGEDIDPDARERSDYGLKCRLYRTGEGLRGTPPDEWIVAALDERKA
jgi:hypothetical protein